jgi:hypothetical protein
MRDEIDRWQGASGKGVVVPTASRCDAVQRAISPHPFGTPHFFAPDVVAPLLDATASRFTPLLAECEKVTGVAIHMSSSTAC